MICNRCHSKLYREDMYDLPRAFVELYCMKCGERVWIDTSRFTWDFAWN
jgi:hypothetical protein